MMEELIYTDSGSKCILLYINKLGRKSIVTIEELKTFTNISYTYIRTILAHLCKLNILIRLCRGVYYYPELVDGFPQFPQLEIILSFLSKRDGYFYCPKGEYARYVLGLRASLPQKIECYTTGKIKTINLGNGVNVKMVPKQKLQSIKLISNEVLLLVLYLKEKGIENISNKEKIILQKYLNTLDNIDDDLEHIPHHIKKFLFFD